MKGLTNKQKRILDFITETLKVRGSAPTFREIARHVGRRSVATIALHIRALVKKGHLNKESWRARSLYPKGYEPPDPGSMTLFPLLDCFVPAGPTQELTEDVERMIYIDRYLVRSKDCFAMRVKGVSMTGAGIQEGDIVIAKRQETADAGDIVIAIKDGEATLKRFVPQKEGILFKAENPRSKSFFIKHNPDDQTVNGVVGKVIKVIRDVN